MIIGVVFALNGYTQTNLNVVYPLQGDTQPNVIKLTTKHIAMDNMDLAAVLRFHNIDFIKGEFTGENLQGKYFTLICKNIWNGEITEVDTIVSARIFKNVFGRSPIQRETYTFNMIGGMVGDSLQVDFSPMTSKRYKAIDDKWFTKWYSLRPTVMRGENIIELNKFTPIFVYMLPYQQGNALMWCAVEQSGHDIEAWGKQFNIEHYMIFEIMFEE